jgi:hypothetical protein
MKRLDPITVLLLVAAMVVLFAVVVLLLDGALIKSPLITSPRNDVAVHTYDAGLVVVAAQSYFEAGVIEALNIHSKHPEYTTMQVMAEAKQHVNRVTSSNSNFILIQ